MSSSAQLSSVRTPVSGGWWRLLNASQWFVFTLAALGWFFDTMDQQLFTISRSITMAALFPKEAFEVQADYGRWATAIFIIGWATGGLFFGVLGDKWGRAKTMATSILAYAIFTGLSGLATTFDQFALFRFFTGLGVGGEFAVGAALVAEVMPEGARAGALGMLQALSAIGNVVGALLLGVIVPRHGFFGGWQGLYFVGAAPALLAVFVFFRLREPEKWVAARRKVKAAGAAGAQFGAMSQLFSIPRWRRSTLVGLGLVTAGALTLWGAGFWGSDLIDSAIPTIPGEIKPMLERDLAATPAPNLASMPEAEAAVVRDLTRRLGPHPSTWPAFTTEERAKITALVQNSRTKDEKTRLKSTAGILQQIGAFTGMCLFGLISSRIGHKKTFFFSFLLGWTSLVLMFYGFHHPYQIWFLWPMMGIGVLGPFGGYAIYLPELFPTRLRSTGISFCYNVARYVTAGGLFVLSPIARHFNWAFGLEGFRVLSLAISFAYLFGFLALIWAPETSGKPLPED